MTRVVQPNPSHKTQLHVVRLLTGWSLAEIDNAFAGNELMAKVAELDEYRWPVGASVRRHSAASYHAAIDLSDPSQRARLLHVYDDILASDDLDTGELQRLLRGDGIQLTADGAIAPEELAIPDSGPFDAASLPQFSLIRDDVVLREHAVRMQRALGNRDPADALLAARELLETVCKLVAEDYGKTIPKNASLGQLYAIVADELGLRAAAIEGDSDASKAARKVLQGLASIADGMGELRTRIGRGHGHTRVSPARQRHAELGTNAAATLALFILDTWHERRRDSA
jgi:Abortive infection C-terminus